MTISPLTEVDSSTLEGKRELMMQAQWDMQLIEKHAGDGDSTKMSALATEYWSRKADEIARWAKRVELEHPETKCRSE